MMIVLHYKGIYIDPSFIKHSKIMAVMLCLLIYIYSNVNNALWLHYKCVITVHIFL